MAGKVRLDKWLWAARFYKTRSQSSLAIKGGKVDVDGGRAKPSAAVAVGTRIQVRKGPYEFDVEVIGLADRRGSAEVARGLYREDPESERRREETRRRIAAERAAVPRHLGHGRPTKKQRRDLMAFKAKLWAPEDYPDDLLDD